MIGSWRNEVLGRGGHRNESRRVKFGSIEAGLAEERPVTLTTDDSISTLASHWRRSAGTALLFLR
jgi:hypothetical protein